MSQSQKNAPAIVRTEMPVFQAGSMTKDQIRKTVELFITKKGETAVVLSTDAIMSVAQKTVLPLPDVKENDVLARIVSVNQLRYNGAPIMAVTYTGVMTNMVAKLATALAATCESIRGGYFPGHAVIAETKTQIGGIDAPEHFRNIVVLNKANEILFSSGKTLQKISVANFMKKNWSATKIVNELNSEILYIGRPSEDEENVFVVTESTIFTVNIVNKSWSQVKEQSRTVSKKALAYFKEGGAFISLLNDNTLEIATTAAAA